MTADCTCESQDGHRGGAGIGQNVGAFGEGASRRVNVIDQKYPFSDHSQMIFYRERPFDIERTLMPSHPDLRRSEPDPLQRGKIEWYPETAGDWLR